MTTPAQVYDYDMRTRERTLLKTQEVPSGHDPEHYVTRRLMATAADGELVPVSLLHHKDTPLDGSRRACSTATAPTASRSPRPSTPTPVAGRSRLRLRHRTHTRRQGQGLRLVRGRQAREEGNTFTDFIAVASHLVERATPAIDRIVAQGGSAGGMLMGAVANMAPRGFRGIIAEVPFVDVLNTMLDDSLPLTPPEWPEWGNPIESEKDYRTIAAYSPYDNVSAQSLSAHPRRCRPHRPARHLLGAGEVGGAAARPQRTTTRSCSASTWMPATAAPPAASRGSRRSPTATPSR
jgi:oligopeptidase B